MLAVAVRACDSTATFLSACCLVSAPCQTILADQLTPELLGAHRTWVGAERRSTEAVLWLCRLLSTVRVCAAPTRTWNQQSGVTKCPTHSTPVPCQNTPPHHSNDTKSPEGCITSCLTRTQCRPQLAWRRPDCCLLFWLPPLLVLLDPLGRCPPNNCSTKGNTHVLQCSVVQGVGSTWRIAVVPPSHSFKAQHDDDAGCKPLSPLFAAFVVLVLVAEQPGTTAAQKLLCCWHLSRRRHCLPAPGCSMSLPRSSRQAGAPATLLASLGVTCCSADHPGDWKPLTNKLLYGDLG